MAFNDLQGLRMRSWDDYAQQMFFIGKVRRDQQQQSVCAPVRTIIK